MLSDQLIRTHIYAAHIGSGISSRRVSPIEEIPHLEPEDIIIYHMSTESGMYAHIRRIKRDYGCTIIFRYHSITPPEYFEAHPVDAIVITAPGYTDEIAGIIRKRFGDQVEIRAMRSNHLEMV